jgi:hypothetical protein
MDFVIKFTLINADVASVNPGFRLGGRNDTSFGHVGAY